jgi:dolichol-phosphate mannosyltransferase
VANSHSLENSAPAVDQTISVAAPVLTVIVPVFNEVKTVTEVLCRLIVESTFKDIIIVDDGSTDGTSDQLTRWHTDWCGRSTPPHIGRVHLMRHSTNHGKGAAIRTAMTYARPSFVVVQDADLEVSPEEFSNLLKPLIADEADIVVGFRALDRLPHRFAFQVGIQFLNLLVRVLYRVRLKDEACCFKVLHLRHLNRMKLECTRFEYCPELVAKAARLNLRFAEVPVAYSPRNVSDGKKLRLRDGLQAIATLWKYRHWQDDNTKPK